MEVECSADGNAANIPPKVMAVGRAIARCAGSGCPNARLDGANDGAPGSNTSAPMPWTSALSRFRSRSPGRLSWAQQPRDLNPTGRHDGSRQERASEPIGPTPIRPALSGEDREPNAYRGATNANVHRENKSPIRVGSGEICWCRRVESNHRPRAYESLALPLSYVGAGNTGKNTAFDWRPSTRRRRPDRLPVLDSGRFPAPVPAPVPRPATGKSVH